MAKSATLATASWGWEDSRVYVTLSRDVIQNGPEYVDGITITREYEELLYSHYGRPPYWQASSNSARVLALTV